MSILSAPLLEGTLLAEQVELEQASLREGSARFRKSVRDAIDRGQGGGLPHAAHYITHWLMPCAKEIVRMKRSLRSQKKRRDKAGDSYVAGPVLSVPTRRLALATIETTLSQMFLNPDGVHARKLYHAIGSAALAEAYYDELRRVRVDLPPTTPAWLKEKKETETARAAMERKFRTLSPAVVNQYARGTLEDEVYRARVTLHTGCRLFICLLESASAAPPDQPFALTFRIGRRSSRSARTGKPLRLVMVTMDDSVWESLHKSGLARERLRPVHTPMIVQPYPWKMPTPATEHEPETPRIHGGYIKNRAPFVSRATREQREALDAADLSGVYEAVNTLGSTRWRINARVADVQRAVLTSGGAVAGLPRRDDLPLPTRLPEDATEAEVKVRNREAVKVWRQNIWNRSELTITEWTLWLCDTLAKREALYFPHQLDWRGRAYSLPQHLNAYGPDPRRALLEFADAKPMTKAAAGWLEVVAANHFGVDKVSFEDRRAWAENNRTDIERSAKDPERHRWWMQAKKPWQFLSACFALVDAEAGMRLPMDFDGSCNGLQHYAAMLRDEAGGALVNLVPGAKPADIYSAVLEAARPIVAADGRGGKREATQVLPLLSRDIVKQPVMTTVYGVTGFGIKRQLKGTLRENLTGDDLYACARYLSGVVERAIGTIVESAAKAMCWLRDCGLAIVDAGHAPGWTTPLGLPVVQHYRRNKRFSVNTVTTEFRLKRDDPTAPLRRWKQARALAPNFVHSADATHMMLTARECGRRGLAFSAVHDSYRSHAADADQLSTILRREFIRLHERPLLEVVAEQWRERYRLGLPDPPTPGTLDLSRVAESRYFFH